MYDCIIVGAGPSGMMCAITSGQTNKKTLLIEKNLELGKKMKLSGGTRCNITNLKAVDLFIKNLPTKNGRFLFSALNNFSPLNIYHYFENLGIKLKTENDNRVFPVSNKASDFITALGNELTKNHVEVLTNTTVLEVEKNQHFKIITSAGIYYTQKLVIATGGLSYPHTGSTGFGLEIAKQFNHHITELFPTESPLISHDEVIISKLLQGLSFPNITLSLLQDGKVIKKITDDLIITHFGLSGPCALKLSQFVYHKLKENKAVAIQIDFIPQINSESLLEILKINRNEDNLLKYLTKILPKRLADYFYHKLSSLSNQQILLLNNLIKKFTIKIHEVKPIQVAFVTGGGVALKEINPKTMESKLVPGLYFIGEVLDIHGYTGGYNMTIALATGYTAGFTTLL